MVNFKGMSNINACSRIILEGRKTIIRQSQKVFYLNPGTRQQFHDFENKQTLEMAYLRCGKTGAQFSIKVIRETENTNIFLYSEFLRRGIGNRLFVVHLDSPEGRVTSAFFCQTQDTLRQRCLMKVTEDIFMKDENILQEDAVPKTIIQDLRCLISAILHNENPRADHTFLSQKTNIVDI